MLIGTGAINNEIIYNSIEEYYPGLIVLRNKMLYLSDQNISRISMGYQLRGTTLELIGYDVTLFLYFKTVSFLDGDAAGSLDMKYDFGLSDQTCLDLHNHNISAVYTDSNSFRANGFGKVRYDMVSIARRHTINSIINDDNYDK